ncbi:hypothetical protein [Streptomyces sp. NPDC048111]|uniref:hypothetical protein n=1 Tax=Streptomyces sp. NPDC048111 TaxID=3365500 RepID=UPI00371E0945
MITRFANDGGPWASGLWGALVVLGIVVLIALLVRSVKRDPYDEDESRDDQE